MSSRDTTTWMIVTTLAGDDYESVLVSDGPIRWGDRWAPLGPPHPVNAVVRTWPTKTAAQAAYRQAHGQMPRTVRAVQLTAEQAALLNPRGGNTKPVTEKVADVLVKATEKAAPAGDTLGNRDRDPGDVSGRSNGAGRRTSRWRTSPVAG